MTDTWKENKFVGNCTEDLISYLETISAGSPDPLQAYLPYISDYKTNFLESVLKRFLQNPLYSNDYRYIKLWIIYADSLENPAEIYNFLLDSNIGHKTAILYVALADIYESNFWLELSELVYLKGIMTKAKPFEKLNEFYQEFLSRKLGKKSINQEISIEEIKALPKLREILKGTCETPNFSPYHTPVSEKNQKKINTSAYKKTPEIELLYHSPCDLKINQCTPPLINGRKPLGMI